jgi:SAM-dependent methyltransferase
MYQPFQYQPDYINQQGWDTYADTYAKLLVPDTVYYLTKEVIHRQIADLFPSDRPVHVLDLNCGVGNDFPFFLARGWKITACDGSVGMLNNAFDKYRKEIEAGQINLYQGQLETLDEHSFRGLKFDLIYSVTGGYAYVADDRMRAVDAVLGQYLAAEGLMVTAHLNSFCPSDLLYQLLHARVRQALVRLRRNVPVRIKGQEYHMFLRGPNKVSRLSPPNLQALACWPLLWFTPPYQTGFKPAKWAYRTLRAIEMGTRHFSPLAFLADQVVAIAKRRPMHGGNGHYDSHVRLAHR